MVIKESRIGGHNTEQDRRVSCISRLLPKLTNRRLRRCFPAVDHAPGNLKSKIPGTMPKLSDKHDLLFWSQSHDIDPVARIQQADGSGFAGARGPGTQPIHLKYPHIGYAFLLVM